MGNHTTLQKFRMLIILITPLLGCAFYLYLYLSNPNLIDLKTDGLIIIGLVMTIIICDRFTIPIPPKGNNLTLESVVYLAVLLVFGLHLTLAILFVCNLIFMIYKSKAGWWNHLFTFSVNAVMIIGAYLAFTLSGGEIGTISFSFSVSYILALIIYMLIQVFGIGFLHYLTKSINMLSMVNEYLTEILARYLSTLVLTLIFGILLEYKPLSGIILFVLVILLLSTALKGYDQLYNDVIKKANKDELTGLYNHGYFKAALAVSLNEKQDLPLSLALIDLDDFKKYNDEYGHLQGDKLLKFFGSFLKSYCSESNLLLARYSGEEFVVLMPDTNDWQAYRFIDRLRKKINDTYFMGVETLPQGCLSFSGGISTFNKAVYSSSEFIGEAYQALHYAKAQGKNYIHLFNESDLFQQNLDHEREIEMLEQQVRIFLSKDVTTYKHSKRVYSYAIDFASKLALSERESKVLIMGALIHDIGKLEIPRDIINKKTKLEPFEWEMIKKHVIWGKEIVATNKKLDSLLPLVELHHERYDGKGYPNGLQGDNIPKLARILCIIDSFDAMTTERPYQKTKSFDAAIEELIQCSGHQFDPDFILPFIEMIEERHPLKITKAYNLPFLSDNG